MTTENTVSRDEIMELGAVTNWCTNLRLNVPFQYGMELHQTAEGFTT